MMKNEYEVRGDITAIFVRFGKGDFVECLIDTKNLEKAKNGCDNMWHLSDNGKGKLYVTGAKKVEGKNRTVKLHRIIMDAPRKMVVDHIEGDTLDNREFMLKVVTQVENMQNSKLHSTNTSGVRGLYYHKRDNLWIGGIWSNKKYHHIGCWKPEEFDKAKDCMAEAYKTLHSYVQEVKQ